MLVVGMFACQQAQDPGQSDRWDTGRTATPHTDDLRQIDEIPFSTVQVISSDPLVARIDADLVGGEYPLSVAFDATASEATGTPRFEWSFGDGAVGDGLSAAHTYVGEGVFEASLTVIDDLTGAVSESSVSISVSTPACRVAQQTEMWGHVDDTGLSEISGLVASRRNPDAYWVHEDSGNDPVLYAIDKWGATLGSYTLPDDFSDFEDLAAAVDPQTGVEKLFLGDIGNNGHDRGRIAVWVADEPDPYWSSSLDPFRMELDYPNGESLDSETLLVDPMTLDVFIVTKEYEGPSKLYVKRAPHEEGSFELEDLGEMPVEITATAGDVSPDGTRVVVRDYSPTAWLWMRDGYRPLEDILLSMPCEIGIESEPQGEAVGFTLDGAGIVTLSEGSTEPLYYTEL